MDTKKLLQDLKRERNRNGAVLVKTKNAKPQLSVVGEADRIIMEINRAKRKLEGLKTESDSILGRKKAQAEQYSMLQAKLQSLELKYGTKANGVNASTLQLLKDEY